MSRPAETLAAALGALLTVVVSALAVFDITIDPKILTAIGSAIGFVAATVTWYVARRQRDPQDPLTSGPDGAVGE